MREITLEAVLRDILYQMSRAEGKKVTDIANCFVAEYLNEPCFKLPISRLNELVKADKEERCVILPVKVGDIVYQITRNFISEFKVFYIEISTCENIFIHTHLVKGINMTGEVFPSTRIGENLFLSHKEAEQALKERKQMKKLSEIKKDDYILMYK